MRLIITNNEITNGKINIPNTGIIELICSGCDLIEEIPKWNSLKIIRCEGCLSLTKIPSLPLVSLIICNDCPLLTEIPDLPRVREIVADRCPLISIGYLPSINFFYNERFNFDYVRNNNRFIAFLGTRRGKRLPKDILTIIRDKVVRFSRKRIRPEYKKHKKSNKINKIKNLQFLRIKKYCR